MFNIELPNWKATGDGVSITNDISNIVEGGVSSTGCKD